MITCSPGSDDTFRCFDSPSFRDRLLSLLSEHEDLERTSASLKSENACLRESLNPSGSPPNHSFPSVRIGPRQTLESDRGNEFSTNCEAGGVSLFGWAAEEPGQTTPRLPRLAGARKVEPTTGDDDKVTDDDGCKEPATEDDTSQWKEPSGAIEPSGATDRFRRMSMADEGGAVKAVIEKSKNRKSSYCAVRANLLVGSTGVRGAMAAAYNDDFDEVMASLDMSSTSSFSQVKLIGGARSLQRRVRAVLSHSSFDFVIGLIIALNAVCIAVESNLTKRSSDDADQLSIDEVWGLWGLKAADNVFLWIYVVELGMRFFAYGARAWRDNWVKFDAFLIGTGLVDFILTLTALVNSLGDNLTLMRMMRLMRLARAVRLVSQFRTLWLLVNGLLHCIQTICWTFLLMAALILFFAIVGVEIINPDPAAGIEYAEIYDLHFSTLAKTMLTLCMFISLDSIGAIYMPLTQAKPFLSIYFVSFTLIAAIALMNLVTAIMVESSMKQANNDHETRKTYQKMQRQKMIPLLQEMFVILDTDETGDLRYDELQNAPEELIETLQRFANLSDVDEIFQMLDYDGSGAIAIDEFVDGLMKCQAENKPMELIRIMKQCKDISARVIQIELNMAGAASVAQPPNLQRQLSPPKK